jgi:hypothetical protein
MAAMKVIQTLIAIAAIGVGSQAFGKAYPGLEVGFTFREMDVVVEDPGEEAKKIGLTREDIERTVKLKLLTRGFKVVPTGDDSPTGSYLYVVVNNIGEAVSISVRFEKLAAHFGIPNDRGTGSVFAPGQGTYSSLLIHIRNKKFILDFLEEHLDKFILDYLESNLRYEATLKDKKLRDIDRVIKRAADADLRFNAHHQWTKRYNALMKEK